MPYHFPRERERQRLKCTLRSPTVGSFTHLPFFPGGGVDPSSPPSPRPSGQNTNFSFLPFYAERETKLISV